MASFMEEQGFVVQRITNVICGGLIVTLTSFVLLLAVSWNAPAGSNLNLFKIAMEEAVVTVVGRGDVGGDKTDMD